MSLIVACPNCQTRYNLPPKFAGKTVKCKSCNKPFAASVGAAQGQAGQRKQPVQQRVQQQDPDELAKMGIGTIRHAPDPFADPATGGPDPLRNHVVHDPGFSMPATGSVGSPIESAGGSGNSEMDDVVSNPYIKTLPKPSPTAGRSSSGDSDRKGKAKAASSTKRFFTFIIDYIVVQVVSTGVAFVAGIVAGVGASGGSEEEIAAALIIAQLVSLAAIFVLILGYFIVLEVTCGRTLGKLICGTKVVSENGSRISFVQCLGRTLCRLIPFEPFSFFFCADRSRPVGWHDKLSGTRVVDV